MLTPVLRPGERLPYIPFGTKTRPTRLYVRGRVSCHQIPYGYMPIVTHPPWNPNRLIITVNQLVIVVRGNAIAPIADAIGLQACDFIQEYDPEYFLEPIDPHAPLVTGIQSKLRHGLAEDEDAGDELAGPARLRAGGG